MNIIGEKPLDIWIDHVYIILYPSYKYINIETKSGSIHKIDYLKKKTKINIFVSNLIMENNEIFYLLIK